MAAEASSQAASANIALDSPISLPCGRRLPNRLVKAAMEELLSTNRLPNEHFERLYRAWSQGGFGMIISGNVQVSTEHLGLPLDVAIPAPSSTVNAKQAMTRFSAWAVSMQQERRSEDRSQPLRIMQLNHPGRQSVRVLTGRSPFSSTLAPSVVPMTAGRGALGRFVGNLAWGSPKAMDVDDIDRVIEEFRRGANVASESGWDGVQLHASHGYLLAQFLSPRTNWRTDSFGGTGRRRIELLIRIIDAIRQDHPLDSGFVLGIKLNASDFIKGGLTEEDALENVKWITQHGGIDFIEISGGSYEAPEFLSMKPSTSRREAFFADFSRRAYHLINEELEPATSASRKPLILLTGGFRSRKGMQEALSAPVADLVGIGRPAAVDPYFARKILDADIADDAARLPTYDTRKGTSIVRWLFSWLTLFGPSLDVLYHNMLMHSIALECEPKDDHEATLRTRLVPLGALARRNYIDPWFAPSHQRLVLWTGFSLMLWGFVSQAGLNLRAVFV